MVNWVEKAGLKKIKKLLEISEQRHHEILLTMNNFRELICNPSSYILPVIPHPLPAKVVEGEHYVVADLLTLVLGSSSPARLPRPRWLVGNWQSVFGPCSRLWLERSSAFPSEHLRRLIVAAASIVVPS